MSIVLIFGTIPIAADNVSAATTSSYSPYAKIEYSYSPNVSCGTIRYITQVTGGSYFNWNYWPASPFGGYAAPESECGTASISMALSYIGISKTPREILGAYNGYTQFIGWGESTHTSMSASSISTAMSKIIELLEGDEYLNKYNIKNIPGLIINEKKVCEGKVLNDREILRMIKVLS